LTKFIEVLAGITT